MMMNIWEKLVSKGKQIHLIILNQQVLQLHEQGQDEQAIKKATHICNTARRYWGETHQVFATCLNNLAALYEETGDYIQAEQFYQKALAIRQDVREENHPDIIDSLENLAGLYSEVGNYSEAERFLQQKLALIRKYQG